MVVVVVVVVVVESSSSNRRSGSNGFIWPAWAGFCPEISNFKLLSCLTQALINEKLAQILSQAISKSSTNT